jgi:hypothetical protein
MTRPMTTDRMIGSLAVIAIAVMLVVSGVLTGGLAWVVTLTLLVWVLS